MTTKEDLEYDQRIYKQHRWEIFFERFEDYVKAVIRNIDQHSDVSDAVRLSELRYAFIQSLIDKEFDL